MAVYEHTYRQYEGKTTPEWSRFLIIPRHAYRSIFGSKLFIALFVACFLYPLYASIMIYLHHNENALAIMKATVGDIIPIDANFFFNFILWQGTFAFFLNLLIGPPLVSRDLANNALPLYLCRPFSRAEYVLGKMSVVMILLSLIMWIPGLLLFFFQAYLEGGGWLWQNLHIAGAILVGSFVWIILLALMSQAISALVKWRVAASAVLLAIFFIPAAFGQVINNIFWTRWGNIINLNAIISSVWAGLFGTFVRQTGNFRGRINGQRVNITMLEPPLWCSWLALALFCAFCLYLLVRKVRAYEVVR
jgi:ABC-2 type transport system permease protein